LYRKRAVAFVFAVFLAGSVLPAQFAIASTSYALRINGVASGHIPVLWRYGNMQVAFGELASRLHRQVWRHGSLTYLQLDDQRLRISPADNIVRCGDEDIYHLAQVPVLAGHDLYLGISDVQRLLDVHVQVAVNGLDVTNSASRTTTFESPATRVSRRSSAYAGSIPPIAFQSSAAAYSNPLDDRSDNRPHFVVELALMNGGTQGRTISLQGGGTSLHGSLEADSYANSPAWMYGSLVAGSQDRHVQIGQQSDALSGIVFDPKSAVGSTYEDRTRGVEVFDTFRNGTRHYAGVTLLQPTGTLKVAALREDGKTAGVLAGFSDTYSSGGAEISREFWLSSRGAAMGLHTQSRGRLFVETLQTFATRTFPLDVGDAPIRENLGYRFSPVLTLRGGVSSGYGVHANTYFNVTLATRFTNLLLTKSAAQNAFALTTHDDTGYVTFASATGPGTREWRGEGARIAGRGQLQFLAWSTNQGLSDSSIEWRSTRTSTAFVLGYEMIRQNATSRTSPLAGVSLALNRDLAIQLETHPLPDGQRMRVSIAQRIDVPQRHRATSTIVQVRGAGEMPVHVFVDETLDQTLERGMTASVHVPDGMHTLRAESSDGSLASVSKEISSGTRLVTLDLLPVRTIKGRVVVADPHDFVSPPSLDGIEVDLLPGGAPAITDAAGYFKLPAQPISSDATVSPLDESLPPGTSAVGNGTAALDGFVTIVIRANRPIVKTIF